MIRPIPTSPISKEIWVQLGQIQPETDQTHTSTRHSKPPVTRNTLVPKCSKVQQFILNWVRNIQVVSLFSLFLLFSFRSLSRGRGRWKSSARRLGCDMRYSFSCLLWSSTCTDSHFSSQNPKYTSLFNTLFPMWFAFQNWWFAFPNGAGVCQSLLLCVIFIHISRMWESWNPLPLEPLPVYATGEVPIWIYPLSTSINETISMV